MRMAGADRQQHILQFIQAYTQDHGYPPSVREIGAAVGLRSTASVARYLKALEQAGYIVHPPSKRRAWSLDGPARARATSVPVVGRVPAGLPSLAHELIDDQVWVSAGVFATAPDYFLRVVGDSMVDAGIYDGDLAAVQMTTTAQNGDIVVGLIGEEATLKYFYATPEGIELRPANRRYQPIRRPDIRVVGRVVGIIRRL